MNVRLKPWSIAMRFEKLRLILSEVFGFQNRPYRAAQRLSAAGEKKSPYLKVCPKNESS